MELAIDKLRAEVVSEKNKVFAKSEFITDTAMSYCPGCGHGVVHRLIMEVLEELDLINNVIGVSPVGCSVFAYDFLNIDMHQASHGRAPAVATGIKRMMPETAVFTYQGDGDIAAIGTAETIHAINRGENITVIFVNNGIYGMTGGQMAPTTLSGMSTSTSPFGRENDTTGYPLKISEMVALLPGASFVSRQAVHTPKYVMKCKRAIKTAFKNQMEGKGTSVVEVLSNCNSGWKMKPVKSNEWLEDNMVPYFPLGDIKKAEK